MRTDAPVRRHNWIFEGQEIFKRAVIGMSGACADVLAARHITADDIDLVVPHQANLRIIEAVAKRAGLPMERVFVNVQRYGNMSAATVPVALVEALEEGRVRRATCCCCRHSAPGSPGARTWCAGAIASRRWAPRTSNCRPATKRHSRWWRGTGNARLPRPLPEGASSVSARCAGVARNHLSARPPVRTALLQIHFCVVLWGFTAILGKLISLPALPLVWWRMLLVVAAIALWPPVWRALRATDRRTLLLFSGAGVIVAVHWLTFYGAIKLSNASVAASCMGVAPIFMALVEPLILRGHFDPRELIIGIVALPGVALVVGGTPCGMRSGIVVGIVSALLVAMFGALNKRIIELAEPMAVTGLELAAGTVFLAVAAWPEPGRRRRSPIPDGRDSRCSSTLSIGCTLLPFSLALRRLAATSAFTPSWRSASSRSTRSCWPSCCWTSSASCRDVLSRRCDHPGFGASRTRLIKLRAAAP